MGLTDVEILGLAKKDPHKAFHAAFNQYWEELYRHALGKVASDDNAKDLVQEVFIACWDHFDTLTTQDKLLPYLYAILRNKIIKQFDKDAVRLRYAVQYAAAEIPTEPSPQQVLLSKELEQIITDEIKRMPGRMREIFQLRREEGLSIREIANQLGLSEQTIKNQLHTATDKLKKRLSDYGLTILLIGGSIFFIPAHSTFGGLSGYTNKGPQKKPLIPAHEQPGRDTTTNHPLHGWYRQSG